MNDPCMNDPNGMSLREFLNRGVAAQKAVDKAAQHRGALNADDCPTSRCRCGTCRRCGYQKHTAIHCGVIGAPDRPYGHVFNADPYLPVVDAARVLRWALEESVELQSHYANLLNMWDGGQRQVFKDASEWLQRLNEVRRIPSADPS